jgi:hypothetical protein
VEGGEVECGETGELVQQYEDKGWVGAMIAIVQAVFG